MSWLNLNDSFNNLKGQISNLANSVLTDDITDPNIVNGDVGELQRLCVSQQEEIKRLQQLSEGGPENHTTSTLPHGSAEDGGDNWGWNVVPELPAGTADLSGREIASLRSKIVDLEKDKYDLVNNLELLDSDHQQNTEELVAIKDKLQNDFSDLEDKYGKLKEDYEKLINARKKDKRELEQLKLQLQSSNNKIEDCTKCDSLKKDNHVLEISLNDLKNELEVLKSNNKTLSKVLDDSNNEIAALNQKFSLSESENKILIQELKKSNETITNFENLRKIEEENCNKIGQVLEGYEQQVRSLENELEISKTNQNENSTGEIKELKRKLSSLVKDRDDAHKKYVAILADRVRKFADCDSSEIPIENDDPQLVEFSTQLEKIMKILGEFKTKNENLESEIYTLNREKTDLLKEKNHEIEKLLQNSEILSQEVITKSQTLKDYESECNELIKNNDILISELEEFKSNSGLQTISESNEDNLLLLENQLENANKRIKELETEVNQNKDTLDEQEISSELVNVHLGDNFEEIREENESLRTEIQRLEAEQEDSLIQTEKLIDAYDKVKIDLENNEYQYAEININMEALKEEVENQRKKIQELVHINSNLEKLNVEYERSNEDVRTELNSLREKLLLEEDNRKQLETTIRNLTEKLQNAKMTETSLKLQYDTVCKDSAALHEAKISLELGLENTLQTLGQCQKNFDNLQNEFDVLRQYSVGLEEKLTELQSELARKTEETEKLKQEEEKFEELAVEESGELFSKLHISPNEDDNTTGMEVDPKVTFSSDLSEDLDDLKKQLVIMTEERDNYEKQIAELSIVRNQHFECAPKVAFLEKAVQELNAAKTELTNVVLIKHEENVTYHNEIQRLSQILTAEIEKSRLLESQLYAKQTSSTDEAKLKEELDKLKDQNDFLRQKTEVLAQNLLEEQGKVQKILTERSNSASEKEMALNKKLERLQTHLVELEDHYTQELLKAEEKNSELQAKVNEIEQREKNSSTMYTSVSIRANQHVETLQNQLQLITNQRDDLRRRISDAEDHASRQAAALANLQFVLEQFQKDKEKDVQSETERIRRQITQERKVQEELRDEIRSLQSQLQESKHGLLAASRLSDQLEQSKQLASTLKTEVSQMKDKLQKSQEEIRAISSQTDGKVDKSLIKNLIIGFVTTNNNLTKDQTQILKIIATVLDFNQQDHDKINLNKPQQGWLGSLLAPQASQGMSQESLSQAFVKFLENESKPRVIRSLLDNNNSSPSATSSRKSSTNVPPRNSPIVLSEVVLPTFADFAQNRNSSSILKDVLKDNS